MLKKHSRFLKPGLIAILVSIGFSSSAQTTRFDGCVYDEQKNPLPGVAVSIKGTLTGTLTNELGEFEISTKGTPVLVFQMIGMKDQEAEAAANMKIIMYTDAIGLDEVIAIGYGTAKKGEVTGAVTSVTSDEILSAPTYNALQGIKGKVAGVSIFTNSGEPNGRTSVLIRGMGTINSSCEPLYVVDGVKVGNIDNLNPNDIERIEVLKDASSAAIYGARGANGVILVSTKRGGSTKGVCVEYAGDISFGTLARHLDVMNSEEYMELNRIAFENTSYFDPVTYPKPLQMQLNNDRLFNKNGKPLYDTNWEKEATRTAISHNHQIAINYVSDKVSMAASFNYTNREGLYLNSYASRYGAKFVLDAEITTWLKFGSNLGVSNVDGNEVRGNEGNMNAARTIVEMPPIFPVKWPDGTYSNSTQLEGTNLFCEAMPNPVHRLMEEDRHTNHLNILSNVFLDFTIIPGLTFRTSFGINSNMGQLKEYLPKNLVDSGFPVGRCNIKDDRNFFWQQEDYLNFDKTWGRHSLRATAGMSWEKNSSEFNILNVSGFPNDYFKYNFVGAATAFGHPGSSKNSSSMNSFFIRGTHSFADKYAATVTARYDGSSCFGAKNKYGFFPSVGLAWTISNEDWMKHVDWIEFLKLRASYGITGNAGIGSYQSLATVGSGTVLMDNKLQQTNFVNKIANPELKWEKSNQVDVGLEGTLLSNILTFGIDYYYKYTDDLLMNRPVPHYTGYTSIMDNIGAVSNQGIELMLRINNINRKHVTWTTSFLFNYNKNRVESLANGNADIESGPNWIGGTQTIIRVGEPLSSIYVRKHLGIYQMDEADEAKAEGKLPGMVKRTSDKYIVGCSMPNMFGSFINTIRYKQFDFRLDFQYSLGGKLLQDFLVTGQDRQCHTSGLADQLHKAWSPDHPENPLRMIRHSIYSGQDVMVDSHLLCSADYLRCNLISLGYTLDKHLLKKTLFTNVNISFTVDNAFLICDKDFKGYDPEAKSWYGNKFSQNIFFYQYPKPRTYSLALKLNF